MQSNQDFRSRLPLPKSMFKSSLIGRPTATHSTTTSSTCFKSTARPLLTTGLGRTTLRAHPYLSAKVKPFERTGVKPNAKEVVVRLDFENSDSLICSPISCSDSAQTPQVGQSGHTRQLSGKADKSNSNKWFESKATSPAIDWNSMTKEAEVVALKTQINRLEVLLEENKLKESQNSVKYELKTEKLNKELERREEKCLEMSAEVKALERKCNEMVVQLTDAREEFRREYEKYEKKTNDLNKTIVELRNQLSDCRVSTDSVAAKHRTQLVGVEHEVQTLRTQVDKCAQEKEVLLKHIRQLECEAQERERLNCQLNKEKVDNCLLTEELNSYKDGIKLSAILDNELQELKTLRQQNRLLSQDNQMLSDVQTKNMILEERVNELQCQLSGANSRLKQSLEIEVESNDLKKRLSEWQELLASDSPTRVSKHLSQLQTNELLLRSELGSLKTQYNQLVSIRTELECDLRSKQNKLIEFESKVCDQNETIKKLNRKCLLFGKEKDSYKRLIASYELDVTLDRNRATEERISSLEAIVDEYKAIIEQLESEAKQVRTDNRTDDYRNQLSQVQNQLDRYKTVNSQLESINASSQKLTLSSPDTCPTCAPDARPYRVMHLSSNPLSLHTELQNKELKRLSDENQRLQIRLELLETGCDADVTRQLNEGIKNTQQVEKLQQKLSSAEKRQQNIIESFKKTSREFREVCYRLTGFRIDLLKQNNYRLSHIYAESPNDVLLFELDTDHTIKLLENHYSQRLQESVNTYLTQHDSFPALLASLTLELFNKQTLQ